MTDHKKLVALLREYFPRLQAVYLFGSAERGDERADSDLDIAVLTGGTLQAQRRFDIAQELAVAFSRDVDLVDLRSANTVMRATIVSAGRRIYCLLCGFTRLCRFREYGLECLRPAKRRAPRHPERHQGARAVHG